MTRATEQTADAGVSLVEVVIAMFLFALLAVSIIPFVWHAQSLSIENRANAAATAFASGLLAEVRAEFPDTQPKPCTAVATSLAARASSTGIVADRTEAGRSARLTLATPCPAADLNVATITAKVYPSASGTGTPLATLSTQIVVTGP